MLILVAGVTGNLGQHLVQSAAIRGHQVRGLGRTPDRLPPEVREKLESFVISKTYYDIPAIDNAMTGVDAVICAYSGTPELLLDGQLILLRATERAGIKRFHPASWNLDWRNLQLGDHESYDPYLCFASQVTLSSAIKPIYMFTGGFAEVWFSAKDHSNFGPENNGEWDPEKKALHIWGSGNQILQMTTEPDAAEFSIEAITADGSESGGSYVVSSENLTLREIAKVYEEVRGRKVEIVERGTQEILEETARKAREKSGRGKWWEYIGYYYSILVLRDGKGADEMENDKFPGVKRTSLKEFLGQHPEV